MILKNRTSKAEKVPIEILMQIFKICLNEVPAQNDIGKENEYQQTISKLLLLNKNWRNFILMFIKEQICWSNRTDIMLLKVLHDAVLSSNRETAQMILNSGFYLWSRKVESFLDIGRLPDCHCSGKYHARKVILAFLQKLSQNYHLHLHTERSKIRLNQLAEEEFSRKSPNLPTLFAKMIVKSGIDAPLTIRDDQLPFLPNNSKIKTNNPIAQLCIEIEEKNWLRKDFGSFMEIGECRNISTFSPSIKHLKVKGQFNVSETLHPIFDVLEMLFSRVIGPCGVKSFEFLVIEPGGFEEAFEGFKGFEGFEEIGGLKELEGAECLELFKELLTSLLERFDESISLTQFNFICHFLRKHDEDDGPLRYEQQIDQCNLEIVFYAEKETLNRSYENKEESKQKGKSRIDINAGM